MKSFESLHQEALSRMKSYLRSTHELMETIGRVDQTRAYLQLGYPSLWAYLIHGLKMAESHAHQFISVSRKSREVPELKRAIQKGEVSLPKAALIAAELKPQNQVEWLEKAKTLPTRALREEIAKKNPEAAVPLRITPRSEVLSEIKMGLKKDVLEKLRRAQDLLSQKQGRSVSLEEVLEHLVNHFLEKEDKVKKAERAVIAGRAKPATVPSGRVALPAWVGHRVQQLSQGRCQGILPNGQHCTQERFLHVHHKTPLKCGGSNAPENLVLLCQGHHKIAHLTLSGQSGIRRNSPRVGPVSRAKAAREPAEMRLF
ncbi:HNH endonuclease [bacterium]|nr:HNH endonuclease [bacterium]